MRLFVPLALLMMGNAVNAAEPTQVLSQDEFSVLMMEKLQGGKNPLFLAPPKVIRDRSSLTHFMFLLKNGRLGMRSGLVQRDADGVQRLKGIEYYEIEQPDESHLCYTYLLDESGSYHLIDQFALKRGDTAIHSGTHDREQTSIALYSSSGETLRQISYSR
jgi:hypothetical protein